MCPSYRTTRNEGDSVWGRANSLRLALSGQLGPDALVSDEMADTLKLCVSCKACKRECPTGVDMARMKVEVTALRTADRGLSIHDRLIAHLPDYAPYAAKIALLVNLMQSARRFVPGLSHLVEKITGFTAKRDLPQWQSQPFGRNDIAAQPSGTGMPLILFVDTFNKYFEPENLRAALRVLSAAGYDVFSPAITEKRPLCCGRTYLSTGLVEKARAEASRLCDAFAPFVEQGISIVGLEPSCLLALRDEVPALLADDSALKIAEASLTFEELLIRDKPELPLAQIDGKVLLHGHCHQKAFDVVKPVQALLGDVAGFEVELIQTSCCGMAGAFGYGADTYDTSIAMAEANLLPAIRREDASTSIIADGTSCRCQIKDGTGRTAEHVAVLLDRLLVSDS